jgi:cytoskeletal protein CcmA (bactofilin family)
MKTSPNKLSIIDKSLTLDGSVSFRGELIVEGTIKGRLEGDHVIVAEAGQIRAETHVADMTISGVFNGRLTVQNKLTLRSGGKCSGTIICRDLEMEAGSFLEGEIQCDPK